MPWPSPVSDSDPYRTTRIRPTRDTAPDSSSDEANACAAHIGPTVCDELGPTPMVNMSRTLNMTDESLHTVMHAFTADTIAISYPPPRTCARPGRRHLRCPVEPPNQVSSTTAFRNGWSHARCDHVIARTTPPNTASAMTAAAVTAIDHPRFHFVTSPPAGAAAKRNRGWSCLYTQHAYTKKPPDTPRRLPPAADFTGGVIQMNHEYE